MKTKFFTFILALAASVGTIFAESGTCGTSLTWTFVDGVLTISGTGSMKNYDTASLGTPWKSFRSSIISVIIEQGVTTIGDAAFGKCENMVSVSIPNSVTKIGSSAFVYCSSLTSITIPSSITYFGFRAFDGTGLESIHIADMVAWCKIQRKNGDSYIHGNLYLNGHLVDNLTIPSNITTIVDGCFCGIKSITSVTIHSDVTSIGKCAFSGCSSMTSIVIPNSVSSIGSFAFSSCSSMTSIVIPNSVSSIGNYAFSGCSSMTSIVIPNSVTSIGEDAFKNCSSLTSVIIPNSVTSIGYEAFNGCSGLTSMTIPNSVTSIGQSVFYGCTSLSNIYFQGSLSEWCGSVVPSVLMNGWAGGNLYLQDTLLTQAIIPSDVTKINNYTFNKCTSLTSVSISESVSNIGSYAFGNCGNLVTVDVPESVTRIAANAFNNCTGLDSLSLYCKLDSVDNSAFSNCKNIRYLGICLTDSAPSIKKLFSGFLTKSVKEIELFPGSTCCGTPVGGNNHLPFVGNKSVEKITIPANIALIPDSTFMNCKNLKEVSFGLTETSGGANISHRVPSEYKDGGYVDGEWWDQIITKETVLANDIFKNNESLESVYFGIGVKEIGHRVCENCTTLTRIYLAPTVETIGQCAFAGCGLTSISIPNSITNLGHLAFMNNPLETVVMECPTSKCDPGDAGTYGQFANCLNVKSITLLMDGEGRPYLSDVFDWRCFNNLETLIFLEKSTKAYVGEENANTASMPSLTTLKLASTIKEIGGFSFYNTTSLKQVILPASLQEIKYDAFTGSGIKKIISKAKNPPQLGYRVFDRVDKNKATLSVPPGRQPLYAEADIWKEFYGYTDNDNVPTTLSSNEVQTETTSETATVSYPAGYGAAFSDVNVSSQDSGEELSFNFTLGASLLEMPQKIYTANHIKTEDNDSTVINGYSFTIHSLEASTTYDYSIIIYDSSEQVIEEFTGTFTTLEDTVTDLDQITNDQILTTTKILYNGQILIIRGDKTYTLQGQEER